MHHQGHFYFMCVLERQGESLQTCCDGSMCGPGAIFETFLSTKMDIHAFTSTNMLGRLGVVDSAYAHFSCISSPVLKQRLIQFHSSRSQVCTNSFKTQLMVVVAADCLV